MLDSTPHSASSSSPDSPRSTAFDADVAVLGSGFAGSLTALILQRHGLRPLVIDRLVHPRFAIGESSTPIGNRLLHDLAEQHGFDWLAPLAKYGSWQRTYPQVVGGLKRGFSYFSHPRSGRFEPRADHANELLVSASDDDEHGDTHWRRADVDALIAGRLREAGIPYFDKTRVERLSSGPGADDPWRIVVHGDGGERELTARFLIDGSGEAAVLPRTLEIPSAVDSLQTASRAVFTHLNGVGSWSDWMRRRGGRTGEHPFSCDDAAQHHLLDGAWVWLLRFNQGTTSVGLTLDMHRHPLDERLPSQAEWTWWLARYPSLAKLFETARPADVPGRWIRSQRLQRRYTRAVGSNWALLPHTAAFIDPLHSTGIAHSLCGVERLTDGLVATWNDPERRAERLNDYEAAVFGEIDLIDRLVAGCYESLGRFRLFTAWSMLYFAAATTYERRRAAGGAGAVGWFLCADDSDFTDRVRRLETLRKSLLADPAPADSAIADFEAAVANEIRPYNSAGLCDPSVRQMYGRASAPPIGPSKGKLGED